MVISDKTKYKCYQFLSEEWKTTGSIMDHLKIQRGHTIKILNSLKRDKLIKRKQPQHDFNTCNKKECLWARI